MSMFFRNLAMVCIGAVVLIAMLTAGFFIAMVVLTVGVLFWGYIKLKGSGVIGPSTPPDDGVIEADYEVLNDTKNSDQDPKH